MIGKQFISKIKTWIDPEFGYKLIQPVDFGQNRTLYFTTNPFLEDNEHLLFYSTIDGVENLYQVNYHTGLVTQLTDDPDLSHSGSHIDRKLKRLYVRSKHSIYYVDLVTYQKVEVLDFSTIGDNIEDIGSIGITSDGKYLVTSYPFDYTYLNNDQETMSLKLWRLFKIHVNTKEKTDIRYTNYKIDHIQCSPTDPNYLIYCAWGYWPTHHRVWGCTLDGLAGGPLGDEKPNEHRTHEYFIHDGKQIAYHGKFFEMVNNTFKRVKDTFGIMDASGKNDHIYTCPKGYSPGHSAMSLDGSLIIADGNGHISSLTLNDIDMTCEVKPLFAHHSSMICNAVHPHPSISFNNRYICFTTDFNQTKTPNFYLLDREDRPL